MSQRMTELVVGLFFILGLGAMFILTFQVASLSGNRGESYTVTAIFENIGGLKRGAAVTLGGVTIGRVRDIRVDRDSFSAKATLEIDKEYDNIPKDSAAEILTAGLLGEKYVGLSPGGGDEALMAGDEIRLTQSALVLENIVGQLLLPKPAPAVDP